jgi:N-sulfoglucosamine sulfohydrolase
MKLLIRKRLLVSLIILTQITIQAFCQFPAELNYDADILTNAEEERYGTNLLSHDTDGDKVNDDEEIRNGTNPSIAEDRDNDGLFDDFERQIILFSTSDEISDLQHVNKDGDFDKDNRTNAQEQEWGTNPAFAEPNILFIFPEDMGYYTSERALKEPNARVAGLSTPNIDALASDGVAFTRTFCGQSICSPSKGAIYSGLLPHSNWIWRNNHNAHPTLGGPDKWIPLPDPITPANDPSYLPAGGMHDDLPNLIQMLKANGVYCALTGKLHVQPARNFPYDIFLNTKSLETAIQEAGGRPWFFWANPSETHAPFWKSIQNKLVDPNNPNSAPKDVDPDKIIMLPWLPDTEKCRVDIAQYYSNVQTIDDYVGTMMDKLKNSGQEANTVVVFSPDHGIPEQRGKTSVYPAGTHVPCFIKGAGVQGGQRLNMPVSQMDLNPTFLETYGILPQVKCHAKSLVPILNGTKNNFEDRETIMTESNGRYSSAPHGTQETVARAVCDGRFYYIRNIYQDRTQLSESAALYVGSGSGEYGDPAGIYYVDLHDETVRNKNLETLPYELLRQLCMSDAPTEELYDLDADPWAVNNLAQDSAYLETLQKLRSEMNNWRSDTKDKDQHPKQTPRREVDYSSLKWTGVFDYSNPGNLFNIPLLYPNPASKKFHVKVNSKSNIVVYNSKGNEMYRSSVCEKSHMVNSDSWNAGVYIVQVVNGHKVASAKSLIIN